MFNFFYFPVSIGLLIGSWSVSLLSQLPNLKIILFFNLGILTLYILFVLYLRFYLANSLKKRLHMLILAISCGAFGFSWAAYQAHQHIACMTEFAMREPMPITGTVERVALQRKNYARFDLLMQHPHKSTIQMAWPHPTQTLKPGDTLALKATLTPIHSLFNPNSFDMEKQSFLTKTQAQAQVKTLIDYKDNTGFSFSKIRYNLLQNLQKSLNNLPFKGIMQALILGDKTEISSKQWEVLQKTGTSHLVAISGLHVSIVAGSLFFLSAWLYRKIPGAYYRLHYLSAPKLGAWVAIIAAAGYASLAAWSIPTQRAFIMVSIAMLGVLLQRPFSAWFLYCMALIVIVSMMPLAPLSMGFWLSFLAVGSLIIGLSGWKVLDNDNSNQWKKWFEPQWIVFVALLPFGFLFFQQNTLIGPIANLIAIPLTSLFVVPLNFLGAVFLILLPGFPSIANVFLEVAHLLWSGLWVVLEKLSGLSFSVIEQGYYSLPAFILSCIGCFLLLMPKGLPGRYLGIIACLPFFLIKAPVPLQQEVWFSLLEVGQGLSAVVQTKNHVLVYDTGPRFGYEADAGNRVVVPFLKSRGIRHIDMVVVSHSDLDHRGGLRSLVKHYKPKHTLTPVVEKVPEIEAQLCHAGQHWVWDGVEFEILSPQLSYFHTKKFLKTNNQSCVLKLSTGQNSILFTGDIESIVEQDLVVALGERLRSTILVVPHHGSKSSSSMAFIAQVAPEYALFSTGFYNQFGFPKPEVVKRYEMRGIKTYNNALQGMVEFRFNHRTQDLQPICYRASKGKFWNQMHPLSAQTALAQRDSF